MMLHQFQPFRPERYVAGSQDHQISEPVSANSTYAVHEIRRRESEPYKHLNSTRRYSTCNWEYGIRKYLVEWHSLLSLRSYFNQNIARVICRGWGWGCLEDIWLWVRCRTLGSCLRERGEEEGRR